MSTLKDLEDASTSLSTTADDLSNQVDSLIQKVDDTLAALQSTTLPPEADAAIAALVEAKTNTQAAASHVDTEVAKLDTFLPTPAPPGTSKI